MPSHDTLTSASEKTAREIKFRAWDKQNKEMNYGNFGLFMFVGTGTLGWQSADVWETGVNKAFDLMQFTGLKDKLGNEIYEGDILRLTNRREKVFPYNYEVLYEGSSFKIKSIVKKEEALTMPLASKCAFYESVEVIGNIYQNSELLRRE